MRFKKILLLCKKSAYSAYFVKRNILKGHKINSFFKKRISSFKSAHEEHVKTINFVEEILKEFHVSYDKKSRGHKILYSHYDLIISIGGDGTFLEAARNLKNQILLGVNSSLSFSVGQFCKANKDNFREVFKKILNNNFQIREIPRISLKVENQQTPIEILNDILIAHSNPAAVTRYIIKIGKKQEEHRNSGIWISTAAGSTGAMKSSGGKKLPVLSKHFQYKPRELYKRKNQHYSLTGAVLKPQEKITLISLTRQGRIYIDGAHVSLPFSYGSSLIVSASANPVKAIIN